MATPALYVSDERLARFLTSNPVAMRDLRCSISAWVLHHCMRVYAQKYLLLDWPLVPGCTER